VSPCAISLPGYCRVLHPDQWWLVKLMRLEALSKSPQAFLGSYSGESLFVEDDWRKTFDSASWHGFFHTQESAEPDEIAGIARSSILSDFPGERFIESFWVRPKYRRRQVGRRMLHSIVSEARAEHLEVVRLSVRRTNQLGIKAFRRLGFATVVPARSSPDEICVELRLI
jgi:ribosomal protein S18 acetylase RimI-like enzyme